MTITETISRWFPEFPGRTQGIGLLVGRATLGLVFVTQGRFYLIDDAPSGWLIGSTAILLGCLLLIGFLTPIAVVVGMLGGLSISLSIIPGCSSRLDESTYALFLVGALFLEVLLAGPGLFSIDAKLFGRREITIPRTKFSD